MESMNIALPRPMKIFVQRQVARGGYSSASEYLRSLIREEQKRNLVTGLEELLLEGLKGKGEKVTPEWWREFRGNLVKRHKKAKGK